MAVHGHFKDLLALKEIINEPLTVTIALEAFSEELKNNYPTCSFSKTMIEGKESLSITGHRAIICDILSKHASPKAIAS